MEGRIGVKQGHKEERKGWKKEIRQKETKTR